MFVFWLFFGGRYGNIIEKIRRSGEGLDSVGIAVNTDKGRYQSKKGTTERFIPIIIYRAKR